jgi:hypothetical protein
LYNFFVFHRVLLFVKSESEQARETGLVPD